ncbi:hypothetical protein D0863_09236 [Hortaea werneckii]|uniref:EGF-like domain-containing protein n=1 Tax=Hortaea werneckii TaxID=91943 RepID=A0A3M7DLM1_HORWE|nr:hypothetical protein D0863_09236 [Hortaea werneckii]
MSYSYNNDGGYGTPSYPYAETARQQRPMLAPGQRRPHPPQATAGSGMAAGAPHGARPMRPHRPGESGNTPSSGGRHHVRPRPPPPPPVIQNPPANLYDGSEYDEPDYYESNQHWPFPQPQQQQQSPRGYPQRHQRPEYRQPVPEPARPRVAPANRQYPQGPPAPPPAHHGSGHWTGDGYSSPSVAYSQPAQPQYSQGAFTQAQKRPPLGPPPSARRGPSSYYPDVAPVHPIVEESESMRGSMRTLSRDRGPGGGGHDSMKSYASSIPIGVPDYYLQDAGSRPSLPGVERPVSAVETGSQYSHDDSLYEPSPLSSHEETNPENNREQQPSPEPATLVRHASLGRKSKPVLTTVTSSDKVRRASEKGDGIGLESLPSQQRKMSASQNQQDVAAGAPPAYEQQGRSWDREDEEFSEEARNDEGRNEKAWEAGAAPMVAGAALAQKKSLDNLSQRTSSSDALKHGSGLLNPSSESKQAHKKKSSTEKLGGILKKTSSKELLGAGLGKNPSLRSREPSPLSKEVGGGTTTDDPRISDILVELEKGGAISGAEDTSEEPLKKPLGGLSERAGRRRPPRLDVDAVRDAEARGSLTSLPDLIQRATRLASNLDRGRTASRLGMQQFLEEAGDTEKGGYDKRKSAGGISAILSSFPAPGRETPISRQGDRGRAPTWGRGSTRHSQQLGSNSDGGDFGDRRGKRRCCGMPLWLFLLLLGFLLLLIAAAVVVPVVLVYLPSNEDDSGADTMNTTAKALSSCREQLTCQNGGTNVLTSSGTCQCLCVNGYTGQSCGTEGSAGCTSMSVGSASDATVGDAIPRLLSGASNFSVPLDSETILGLFSGSDLSCNSENALVTLNNHAGAKRSVDKVSPPPPTLYRRQASSTTSATNHAATSNGIVYETGSPPGVSSSASASSSPTTSATPSTSASPSSSIQDDSTTLDFARIAVLYVLQAAGELNPAVTAQRNLQSYFEDGRTSSGRTIDPSNVSLGGGYSCDLTGHSISLKNGTTVGNSGGGGEGG